jgi:hypothetical protein
MSNSTFGDLLVSENKNHFYIMHLSYGPDLKERERLWRFALKRNIIGLDLPKIVTKDWINVSQSIRKKAGSHWEKQFDLFCNEMHEGDYAVILNGTYAVLGIAKITQPKHRYYSRFSNPSNPATFFDHIREGIDWVKTYPWDGLALSEKLTFDGTLDRVTQKTRSPRWRVLTSIQI